ncbi:hypothetical protein AAZX31_05G048300 [Glycine max]|uniref:DUF4378 domain-containing protein n=2 Tax=Glycine subgen. Soja TaxID=1462606 RepID=K7KMY4_SOYBN|nr:uncharacterized protein LOC102663212 [Glycine max]XP_028231654.1 uncharacterized protein LOC114412079 [Glycine soja]KAG5039688.1 hypothetical protein JHK85_012164 [Glycine max]KAG5056837.1 hypothetical protein JHK86_011833 [Glycine max]KAG5153868.1 hypothetical protein JHK82_011837 [Glycine max]KAH1132875.1 hypothetical protein GYH30_011622 [Glycine max]KAH1248945.1 hypothetical protein GmHk_05G012431 [Glycine max]|eukprot:XP_006580652.1 uncharacterized protein LOC102663212 [Glycine max]
MASSGATPLCNNHSLIHLPKRSVLLKDYLRDDLSSCSTNGFKSFPRRQCCTTVGFFGEKDLQLQRKRRSTLPRRRSTTISALQRASGAVINAIKSLPPLSQKSGKAKKGVAGVLCRSFSRKVLSRRFWRKAAAREEGNEDVPRRRRSFHELIMLDHEEHRKATSLNEDSTTVFAAHAPSVTTSSACGSESWGDSEFTFTSAGASSSSESSNENYLVLEGTEEGAPHHKVEEVVTKEYWPNDEKEQFSPESILDCPFEDEEDIYKSQINSTSITLSFSQGRKHKHMHKRCHFESVVPLEPVVLEKMFARLELEDEPHNHYTKQCSRLLVPKVRAQNNLRRDNNHNHEDNARDLLNFVKRSITPNSLITKAENLLFDYFKQSIEENKDIDYSKKLQICKVAEDWINGQPQEMYLGWEVQGGRCVYIREMDKCEEWKSSDQDIQQLGQELANEVFTNLVNEFTLELTSCASH